MSLRVVRLGTPRHDDEGLRIGTVRRPPRGVRREALGSGDWYDVWLPELAPSAELVALALSARDDREWKSFVRRYRAEMAQPHARHLVGLLAALSTHTNLSVGCYCADERRCHRGILRTLLADAGADVIDDDAR